MDKPDALPIEQHPGVQGWAQLDRNAIDWVIELKQAQARDNIAFKQLLAQRDALLEALRDLVQLEVDGCTEYESSIPYWDAARAAIKAVEEGK